MSKFETRIIRESEDGKLLKSGYEWAEKSVAIEMLGAMVAFVGLIGIVIAALLYRAPSAMLAFGLLSGVITVLGFAMVLGDGARRSIIFHADGTIETPSGLPGYRSYRKIPGHHRFVESIEHTRVPDHAYIVRLLSKGGDTVWLAQNLSEASSLKVAVQLTMALTALRDAQANSKGNAEPLAMFD